MKSFGCPRSRRGKLRCSRAINCNLPNAPSANLSESSGPVAIMWVHHMTNMAMYHKFVTLLKCHVANLSARAPPCPCIRRSLTCELYLRWQQASTHAVCPGQAPAPAVTAHGAMGCLLPAGCSCIFSPPWDSCGFWTSGSEALSSCFGRERGVWLQMDVARSCM